MGVLESEFRLLHWVPLVREVVQTTYYPGYRYEFFKSFKELDAYFTEVVGINWRRHAWAEFWVNQHLETKNDDRREWKHITAPSVTKVYRQGARDIQSISKVAIPYLKENPKTSSYKLVRWLAQFGITISQKSAWRIIKRWKANPDVLVQDTDTQRYISNSYLHDVTTPLDVPITAGYTKAQWKEDWKKKHGLT